MNKDKSQAFSTIMSSETGEWYTPFWILEMVKEVLGYIDLDPASCETANFVVQAKRYLTKEDNSLIRPWIADTIFLNPPFGKLKNKSLAGIFADKMIQEYEDQHFNRGIMLLHSRFGYAWFEKLFRLLPVCMVEKKLNFIRSESGLTTGEAKSAQSIFYFGKDNRKFIEVFSKIGRIILP